MYEKIDILRREMERLENTSGCLGLELCICDGLGIVETKDGVLLCEGPDDRLRWQMIQQIDQAIKTIQDPVSRPAEEDVAISYEEIEEPEEIAHKTVVSFDLEKEEAKVTLWFNHLEGELDEVFGQLKDWTNALSRVSLQFTTFDNEEFSMSSLSVTGYRAMTEQEIAGEQALRKAAEFKRTRAQPPTTDMLKVEMETAIRQFREKNPSSFSG